MKRKNTLRTQLGLSQQQMADYLGIGRSLLAHYEASKRDLLTNALLKLSYLELDVIQLEKEMTATNEMADERKIQAKAKLENNAKKCLDEANILEHKLPDLKRKQALNAFQLRVFQAMLAKLDKNDKNYALEKLQIEMWIDDIDKNIIAYETIPFLEIRIKALQFQAEMAKKYFD